MLMVLWYFVCVVMGFEDYWCVYCEVLLWVLVFVVLYWFGIVFDLELKGYFGVDDW